MYCVLIEADPFDCMGSRAFVKRFRSFIEAISYYSDVLLDKQATIAGFSELYCWGEEEIANAKREDYALIVEGKVYILFCQQDLFQELKLSCGINEKMEYEKWVDDYADLTWEDIGLCHLIDAYKMIGSTIFGCYDFMINIVDSSMEDFKATADHCNASKPNIQKKHEAFLNAIPQN